MHTTTPFLIFCTDRPISVNSHAAEPGGTLRSSRSWRSLSTVTALLGISAAGAGAQSSKPKADDVGVADYQIRLAVMADVDTPVQPGLFQRSRSTPCGPGPR